MKIQPAHYAHIKTAIGETLELATANGYSLAIHRDNIVAEGKAKDVEKRLRWDLAYSANLSKWLCDNVYSYADDSHIDTALRSIMRELNA